MTSSAVRSLALAAVLAAAPARAQEIKVEGGLGQIDAAQAQRVVEARLDDLLGCYRAQASTKRYLGGRAELRFRLKRDGKVKWAQLASSDLGAWPVEKCLMAIGRGLSFAAPRGGEGEFAFALEFPPQTAAEPADDGELRPKLKALRACGRAPGRVAVTVYVAAGGEVTSAGFATDAHQPLAEKWGECAWKKLTGLTLRDPRGKVLKATGWYGR